MGQTIITRVGFCPHCFKAEQVKTDHAFIVFGSNGWHDRWARQCSRFWGYVPHIFSLQKVLGQNCIVLRACAVQGCGSEWKDFGNGDYHLWIENHNFHRVIYTIEQWNALVKNPFKNDWDYII